MMSEVLVYSNLNGSEPFTKWLTSLDHIACARVQTYLRRLEVGNMSNTQSVGGGVSEVKISFGPGYRVYFGWDGKELIILLGGGSKKRQSEDIERARILWTEYRSRKYNQ